MLSPPQDALSGEPWQENPMGPGPDFLFCMKPGKTFALVAPEYISGKVSWHRFGCLSFKGCLMVVTKLQLSHTQLT